MAKMTDRLNRRLAGEDVSDDEEDTRGGISANKAAAVKEGGGDSSTSGSSNNDGSTTESGSAPTSQPSLSRNSTEESTAPIGTPLHEQQLPRTPAPLSPRAASNMQMMQMHLQKSALSASKKGQSDDWSVSSIGQSSVSSPNSSFSGGGAGLPPQTRKRKPFNR